MPYGSNIVVGAKKTSTWFTAVQLGALDGGLIEKCDALWNLKRDIIPDESQGIFGLQKLFYGNVDEAFECNGLLRWSNSIPWVHIFNCIGNETSTIQTGSAYLHEAQVDDQIDGHFYTMAALLSYTLGAGALTVNNEIPSIKPIGFTLRSKGDGFLEFVLRGMRSGLKFGDTYCENDVSEFANITFETTALRIPFSIGKFRINIQGTGALSDSNKLRLNAFELNFDRKFIRDDSAFANTYTTNDFETLEPEEDNGNPEITLKVEELNAYYSSIYRVNLDSSYGETITQSQWKSDITFEGGLASGSTNYKLLLEFPCLQTIEHNEPANKHDRIGAQTTFRALRVAAAPTGMTGITKYMKLSLANLRVAVYGAVA